LTQGEAALDRKQDQLAKQDIVEAEQTEALEQLLEILKRRIETSDWAQRDKAIFRQALDGIA
jgi:thioredoxin-like negative regulator of GroEL